MMWLAARPPLALAARSVPPLRAVFSSCPEPAHTSPPHPDTFHVEELEVTTTTTPRRKPAPQELWFGKFFSDHMLMASHSEAGGGWGAPAIRPFADLSLHPASPGLHYGLACFEGMKAFRGDDGVSRMFRPEAHAARLRRSAARLMLADFSEVQLLACMAAMLRLDAGWLPAGRGYSLYIRPLLFASDAELGVHRPRATRLLVISSPTGPYFAGGAGKGSAAAQGAEDGKGTAAAPPLRLLLDESTVRAWPGGVGEHKVAGNYAATVAPQWRAVQAHGCSQVVYTLPATSGDREAAVIAECGAMNLFFLLGDGAGGAELVTPPLDGTILPGITRDSLLQLARSYGGGLIVSERPITVGEVSAASQRGRLLCIFGSGTACAVQTVEAIARVGGPAISSAGDHRLADKLLTDLTDIQYGHKPHPWAVAF